MNIPHWLTDLTGILAPVIALLYFIVQLAIKTGISETNTLLREHLASDAQKHAALDEHFEFADHRLDILERYERKRI